MNTNSTARLAPITYSTTPPLPHPADDVYSSQPLGALYSSTQTTFRVWAPTAGKVTLNLYQSPTGGDAKRVLMNKLEDGCWETVIEGDQLGVYYTYSVAGEDARFDASRELLDPYAKAVTNHDGRSIVVHDKTPVADRPNFPISEAVIYEMHIRDFTIDPDSGIQRRGKYLGVIERDTHLTGRQAITTRWMLCSITRLKPLILAVCTVSMDWSPAITTG